MERCLQFLMRANGLEEPPIKIDLQNSKNGLVARINLSQHHHDTQNKSVHSTQSRKPNNSFTSNKFRGKIGLSLNKNNQSHNSFTAFSVASSLPDDHSARMMSAIKQLNKEK